ncbi:putative homing endonuclease protein [Rhizobium phage RHph_I1_18]|nr:putative homing endonuclease protein [Rhizobium phage RHph_I1_18]
MKYCVYLTTYTGNRLPPFYIGSTSVKRIQQGYVGSVTSYEYAKIWKEETRHRPHLFKVKIVSCYDNRQDAFDAEERLQRKLNVVGSTLYANKSVANGNFSSAGRKFSEEHKAKIRAHRIGKKLSEQQKDNLRKLRLGSKQSESTIAKRTAKNRGRKHTEDAKARIKASLLSNESLGWHTRGVPKSDTHKENISCALKGKQKTDAHIEKIRASALQREKHQCQRCGNLYSAHIVNRWHNDNCKLSNLTGTT